MPGGVDLDLPFTLDRPAAPAAPADRPIPDDAAASESVSSGPVAAESASPPAGGNGVGDGPATGAARPATESPWAYPPQRPAGATGTAHDEAAAGT
ncbi:chromosome partitioning protein, partial [Micromonospora sp. BL4]